MPVKYPPRAFRMLRPVVRLLMRLVFDVRFAGMEHIPRDRNYILISNHLNWIDPFFIFCFFPSTPQIVFVSEASGLFDAGWKGKLIAWLGRPVIPFEREDEAQRVRVLKDIMRALRGGQVVGIFPEGRVGPGEGDMYPFYVGAFMIAKRMNMPILPLGLSGSFKLSFRKPIRFQVGKLTEAGTSETYEEFAERMALMIRGLVPEYPGDGPFPKSWNWMTNLCLNGRKPDDGVRTLIIREKSGNTTQGATT